MAFRSSVRWRGVEINDGVNYLLDTRESTLDDPNPAEGTYASRKAAPPVLTGATLRETSIVLNINIRATSAADLDAKIQQLRRIFNPAELKEYKLERRLPHEQYHRYILAAARSVTFNRTQAKCSVTLQTSDMTWQEDVEHSQTFLLFNGTYSQSVSVNYEGNLPVEPIIEVKAKTPGSDGPTPLYYRWQRLWYWAPERVVNYPIKIIENWTVTQLINDGKMRSDYGDFSVTVAGRTVPHRIVERSPGVIDVWMLPSYLNAIAPNATIDPSTRGAAYKIQLPSTYSTGAKFRIRSNRGAIPAADDVKIGNEIISYNNAKLLDGASSIYEVTIVNRGVEQTTPEDHYVWSPVMFHDTVTISYGYAQGYERYFPNGWGGPWPEIDYITSTNGQWNYTTGNTRLLFSASSIPLTSFNWYAVPSLVRRSREVLEMTNPSDSYAGLISTFPSNTVRNVQRLVLEQPGGSTQRRISALRVVFELTGGPNSSSPGFTVILGKVRLNENGQSAFGTWNEQFVELWRYRHTTTGTIEVDTGYIDTNAWNSVPSHFVIMIPNAPPNTYNTTILRIKEFYIRWDGYGFPESEDYLHWPSPGWLTGEMGVGTGEYPVSFSFFNYTDTTSENRFIISARMADEAVGIIDCQSHGVGGALSLEDVSYKKSSWFRLVPGDNGILFSAGPGTGQIEVTLRWRNRY